MKNRQNFVNTKSNLTLTQSGLLAVLLQRQRRHKVIEFAQRRPHERQLRAPFWSDSHSAVVRTHEAPHLNLSPEQIAMSHQIHTYSEIRQQIHDDLQSNIPNGSSQMANP